MAYLEKLSLPIFEGGLREVATLEIPPIAERQLAMARLLGVVRCLPRKGLADQRQDEERPQSERQPVVSQAPSQA